MLYSALGCQNENQVCVKFGVALHQKPSGKGLGQCWGIAWWAELSTGLSSASRDHKAPTALMVDWCATGHVAGFSLGNAGFCSCPKGLVLYFAGQDILRDSANFFVQSGPENLGAESCWWLLCSTVLNRNDCKCTERLLLDTDLQRPPVCLPG